MKHDMNNMEFKRKLPIPKYIKETFPLKPELVKTKEDTAAELEKIFQGKSNKKVLIIGPCSADNKDSVLEYMERLKPLAEKVKEKLLVIPRLYTNKPRTTGDGYMGMLHQPDAGQKPDMLKGIMTIRELNMKILSDYGFSCADEMLYPENHRYLSDLLAYVTVGARSVENQEHRMVASGLDVPVGMKNPTGGDLDVMMNSIKAAKHPHTFLYRGWEVSSKGNPFSHGVLRGYKDYRGCYAPNYDYDTLNRVLQLYEKYEMSEPSVIIDTNHGNSGKNYLLQGAIIEDVLNSGKKNNDIYKLVKGFMVESYLVDGADEVGKNAYGQSITDPCLGWKKTEELIVRLGTIV